MAKFKITDPETGKTVTVSGDEPPSQDDAEEIFKQAGLRAGGDTQPAPSRPGTRIPYAPGQEPIPGFARTPRPHTGFAAQTRAAFEGPGPERIQPKSVGELAGNYSDIAKGAIEGVPSGIQGIGGDLESFLRLIGRPEGLSQKTFAPTSPGVADYQWGPAKSGYQEFGRAMGNMLSGNVAGAAFRGLRAVPYIDRLNVYNLTRAAESTFGPIGQAGRERYAANRLKNEATNPDALGTVPAGERENIPGSPATSFEAHNDPGLGSIESEMRDEFPAQAAKFDDARKAAQTAYARGLQKPGSPADVADLARSLLRQIDETNAADLKAAEETASGTEFDAMAESARGTGAASRAAETSTSQATAEAQTAAERLGGNAAPDTYGAGLREQAGVGKTASAQAREAIFRAVDPERNLVLEGGDVGSALDEAMALRTPESKPLTGEPERLVNIARGMRGPIKFQSLRTFEAELNDAIAAEKHKPTKSLLRSVKGGVVRAMDRAITQRAAQAPDLFAEDLAAIDRELNPAFSRSGQGAEGVRGAQAVGVERGAEGAGNPGGEGVLNQERQSGGAPRDQGVSGRKVAPRSLIETLRDLGGVRLVRGADGALTKESQDLEFALRDLTPAQRRSIIRDDGKFVPGNLLEQSSVKRYLDPGKEGDLDHLFEKVGQDAGAYGKSGGAPRGEGRVYAPEELPTATRQDAGRRQADVEARADELRGKGYKIPPIGPRERPDAYEARVREISMQDEASQAAGADPNARAFDEAARERLAAAKAKHIRHEKTYEQGVVGETLESSTGYKGDYSVPASMASGKYFTPGKRGAENVEAYRQAFREAGLDETQAFEDLRDYAAAELKSAAMRADGTLDPAKVAKFLSDKGYGPALRAFPDLREGIEAAGGASRAMEDAAAAGKSGIKQAEAEGKEAIRRGQATAKDIRQRAEQKAKAASASLEDEAIGALLNVREEGDAKRVIGTMLGQDRREMKMQQLADRARDNPAAWAGLRRGVVDHLLDKFISDAGDVKKSIVGLMRQNRTALKKVLSDEEIAQLDTLAADMERNSKKRPAAKPREETELQGRRNILRIVLERSARTVGAGAGFFAGRGFGDLVGAIGAVMGADVAGNLRAANILKAKDVLRQAVFHPPVMREILARVGEGKPTEQALRRLGNALVRSTARGALGGAATVTRPDDNRPKSYADTLSQYARPTAP